MEDAEVKQKKRASTAVRMQEELWYKDTRDWMTRRDRLIFRIS